MQGLPNGLLLEGLLGKKWKGLARWFKSPTATDPSLKWGNNYHYMYIYIYYCQVIPRCQDSCCTGEGGFPGPKHSTHHRPSQVGAVQQAEKTDSAGTEIPKPWFRAPKSSQIVPTTPCASLIKAVVTCSEVCFADPPPPNAVRNWASYKIPGLDMAKTSSTSVNAPKSVVYRSWQESAFTQLRNFTPSCYNHNPRIIFMDSS